ncbi:MAG: cyclase family protein [Desulfobacteraceae bacterium]|nr:cyclase family protein [Desulfobacteraceae bacterium]
MKIIDLTHTISPDMPVYPGTEPPVLTTECTIDKTGFLEKKITMFSHTGTHMDAPAHLIKGAKTLDLLPIEQFYGKAFLLDLLKVKTDFKSKTIGIKELEPHQESIEQVEFFLIHTGWSQYWNTDKYFSNYPVLSLEAANWLSKFELKGLGLDTISADKVDTQDFPVHKAFLQQDIIIIENLTNLKKIPCNQFAFSCFPLSFEDADGSPVRAVAFIQ